MTQNARYKIIVFKKNDFNEFQSLKPFFSIFEKLLTIKDSLRCRLRKWPLVVKLSKWPWTLKFKKT